MTFVGLGNMGSQVCSRVQHITKQVTIYDRNPLTLKKYIEKYGGCAASDPIPAIVESDVVFSCLPTSSHVESIARQIPKNIGGKQRFWIDCTSGHPQKTREIASWLKYSL